MYIVSNLVPNLDTSITKAKLNEAIKVSINFNITLKLKVIKWLYSGL